LELDGLTDNIGVDWADKAAGLFSTKTPDAKEKAKKTDKKAQSKEKAGKVEPKSGLGKFTKSLGIVGIIYACYQMLERVKTIDKNDPNYYEKVSAEVGALTARYTATAVGAILGALIGTAIVPGPGSIVGLASGLIAGLYVDYAIGDETEEITRQLLLYLFEDSPEKIPKKMSANQADLPSPNSIEVAFTPAMMKGVTRLGNAEPEAIQKNVLQSLIEGNFKALSFNAGTILFDADSIDWGAAGAPTESSGGMSYDEERDRSSGMTPKSQMPNLMGARSSGTTPQSSYTPHTPNKTSGSTGASGVTPQSGAAGGGTTPSGKDWSGHTYTGDHADILATIRSRESGGDYGIRSSASSASGAYQFINSTWRGLTEKFGIGKEYRTAADAPPQVQDAVAAAYVADILRRNNNDLSKVPTEWYTGNSAGIISPQALAVNKGLTPEMYVDKWMKDYYKISGKSPEMVTNSPQTGATMNSTAVTQSVRAAQENRPMMVPTMARSGAPSAGLRDERSPAGMIRGGAEPTAADMFRSLFNIPALR
jgi:hypothetical protein